MDRYENILKKLALSEKEIDYLKIDIEGSEINFFNDVIKNSPHLLQRVKQIGMEIHPSYPPRIGKFAFFFNMKKAARERG